MKKGTQKYGICAVCGKRKRLNGGGSLYYHTFKRGFCEGSYRAPKQTT